MVKKFLVFIFLFTIIVNAEEVKFDLEEKYNLCSENYEMCLNKCEEENANDEECVSNCENEFYQCNENVDQELEQLNSSQN